MDPNSGRLIPVVDDAEVEALHRSARVMSESEAKARGLVPVPQEELERVKAMSSEERQQWAATLMAGKSGLNRKQRRLAARNARPQARHAAKAKNGGAS